MILGWNCESFPETGAESWKNSSSRAQSHPWAQGNFPSVHQNEGNMIVEVAFGLDQRILLNANVASDSLLRHIRCQCEAAMRSAVVARDLAERAALEQLQTRYEHAMTMLAIRSKSDDAPPAGEALDENEKNRGGRNDEIEAKAKAEAETEAEVKVDDANDPESESHARELEALIAGKTLQLAALARATELCDALAACEAVDLRSGDALKGLPAAATTYASELLQARSRLELVVFMPAGESEGKGEGEADALPVSCLVTDVEAA